MATKAALNTNERSFASPVMEIHDLQAFHNTTATKIPNLLELNCALGMAGFKDCLVCNPGYGLDTNYRCNLKTSLPSYTLYMRNHDLYMECGFGLFYETTLNFCQNCPLGCVECTTLNTCQVVSLGCPSNCKKCSSPGFVCQECNSGFTLNGVGICVACNKVNCVKCPASNLNTCTKCVNG